MSFLIYFSHRGKLERTEIKALVFELGASSTFLIKKKKIDYFVLHNLNGYRLSILYLFCTHAKVNYTKIKVLL